MISIIVAYRNRDAKRVKFFFDSLEKQTNTNFEVVFIDNGSETNIADEIRGIVEQYSFVTYLYHDTRGKEWNKCIALNIAVQYAKGEYISITDIDLMFHPQYVEELYKIVSLDSQIFTRVLMVDQSFTNYELIFSYASVPGELCHTSGKGIVTFAKAVFNEIGGYDEYYSDWGIEDNDMYIRLHSYGLRELWLNHEFTPVYHQWHISHDNFARYPDKWHDDISFHYITLQKKWHRDNIKADIIPTNSRLILQKMNTQLPEIKVEKAGYITTKTFYYRTIWDMLQSTDNEVFKIIVPKFQIPNLSFIQSIVFKVFNLVLQIIKSPYSLQYFQKVERHTYFLPEKDIQWYIRKLVKETDTITDYYIIEKEKETIYYIQSKGASSE